METDQFLSRLKDEWQRSARPLLIVDEVRFEDPVHRQITAFVLCCTNTRRAVEWADRAEELRKGMRPLDQVALFKGTKLYGADARPRHGRIRQYVADAVRDCDAVAQVITTSPAIARYKEIAPGGIRPYDDETETKLPAIRGGELVPFMNMVKLVATARAFGAVQVDVLVDRSDQLGLGRRRLGVGDDKLIVMGPDTLNESADGSPAQFQCPTKFRFLATQEESAFRDLLLLPDSVGYTIRSTLGQYASRLETTDFHVEFLDLQTFVLPDVAVDPASETRGGEREQ